MHLGNTGEPADNPHPNRAVHIESRIMKNVMASASEAETGALFHNSCNTSFVFHGIANLKLCRYWY
jgi:hypothetical protein